MIVISPWSKGGWVNSQVFDHTSLIRFVEARFGSDYPGIRENNITRWRRAVAGDLTTAFDFATPNNATVSLPSTASYVPPDNLRHPDYSPLPPDEQALPAQEPGTRPARALPYELHVHGAARASHGAFRIDFANTGDATAVLQVRSASASDGPRSYTVEPGKQLSDVWNVAAGRASTYDLAVHGPNGFLRTFRGSVSGGDKAHLDVRASYDAGGIRLAVTNLARQTGELGVLDVYTGETIEQQVAPDESVTRHWSLDRQFGWYDLIVTVKQDPGFEYRLAGHVETGKDTVSDPAMGGLRGDR
jgi:phospholipase C